MKTAIAEAEDELKTKSRMSHCEAAVYLGISDQTLYNWNHKGRGPRRQLNLLGQLEYLRSDLDAFKAMRKRIIAAGAK